MGARKTASSARVDAHGFAGLRLPDVQMRRLSALIGGILICATLAWLGWLLLLQHNTGLAAISFPFTGSQAQPTAQSSANPLAAAGITLSTPAQGQTAALTQQQALILAGQIEPQAAAQAGAVSAQYVLFSYQGSKTTTSGMHNVPAWLVHYTRITGAGPDTASDPHAHNTPSDCYLFLAADSGQELFALWA